MANMVSPPMDAHQVQQHAPHGNGEDEGLLNAMVVGTSMAFPMTLIAAVELDIFGIIERASSPISAVEIASQLPTLNQDAGAPSRLDRMLGLFVSHSLLSCSARNLEEGRKERLYTITPACKYFLPRGEEEEGSLAFLIALNFHRSSFEVLTHARDGILEAENQFVKCYGMTAFQYMDTDPTLKSRFNRAMSGISTITMKRVLLTYKGFEGLSSLVDVGGGTGKCLSLVTSKYPSIKGINFDIPCVIQVAPAYPGVNHVEGDMFVSIPEAEAIMLKDVLHNWDDESCVKVLKNCYDVLPSKGKVIVINSVMPETPDLSLSSKYLTSLDNMMMFLFGSLGRTEKEFEALGKTAGFFKFQVACHAIHSVWAVMEFLK